MTNICVFDHRDILMLIEIYSSSQLGASRFVNRTTNSEKTSAIRTLLHNMCTTLDVCSVSPVFFQPNALDTLLYRGRLRTGAVRVQLGRKVGMQIKSAPADSELRPM